MTGRLWHRKLVVGGPFNQDKQHRREEVSETGINGK